MATMGDDTERQRRGNDEDAEKNTMPEWRRRRGGGEAEETDKLRRWRARRQDGGRNGMENTPALRNRPRA
jgi:hypothetical protein